MASFTQTSIKHHATLASFAHAAGRPNTTDDQMKHIREELREAIDIDAVDDAAGQAAFFSLMTRLVDGTGHRRAGVAYYLIPILLHARVIVASLAAFAVASFAAWSYFRR